ncbi:MAG: hypothetical protein M3Z04_05610 [Chloroflexota bacterium]|nr:hypothetical protein [Chloroflexota bacterium]
MLLNGIVWNSLVDMLLDMAAVLIVMTVVMIWVIRTNRHTLSPPPDPADPDPRLPPSEPPVPDTLPPSPAPGEAAWK